jgi:membrane protease YdiL (CAAX protease family)
MGVPLRMPRWGFGDAWIALIAAFVLSASAGVLLVLAQGSRTATNVVVLVSLVLQWVPMVGWPWWATRRRGNGLRTDLGLAITGRDVGIGLLGGFGALVVATAVASLTTMVFGSFGSAAGELVDDFAKDKLLLYVLVVSIAFVAPVVEEICFRGLFWGALAKRGMNQYWVTFWTALAFACFHLEPVRIPLLLCTGLVLGFLRQRTGRLGSSIVAHMVNNSAAALGILFM